MPAQPCRFCETCNIIRPPRASHCRDCDNCVLRCSTILDYSRMVGNLILHLQNVLCVCVCCTVNYIIYIHPSLWHIIYIYSIINYNMILYLWQFARILSFLLSLCMPLLLPLWQVRSSLSLREQLHRPKDSSHNSCVLPAVFATFRNRRNIIFFNGFLMPLAQPPTQNDTEISMINMNNIK